MNRLPFLIVLLLFITSSASAQRYRGFGYDDAPKFRIGLHGGWSYRTAKISDKATADERDYLKGLKAGYHYGANAVFFFNDKWGAGIEYSGFRAGNEADIWRQDSAFVVRTGKLKSDMTISFIGPSFCGRDIFGQNENIHLVGTFALGYLSYKDNATVFDDYLITGGTVGAMFSFSFDVALQKNIFLGVQASLLGGSLSKLTYKNIATGTTETIEMEEDSRENVSRIDLSGGIRINL